MSDIKQLCQNCKQEFIIDEQDQAFYEKMQVPAPTFCPECRLIRRFCWRNERHLYKRTCNLCGNDIISIFAPEKDYKVYCQPDWWSDKWDPMEYARDYDFSKPFFEQYARLMKEVPWVTLLNDYATLVNSEYVNMAGHLKNCYLISHADHNEDCAYGSGIKYSKDCYDTTMMQHSERCYGSLNIMKGHGNFYSVDCENSSNVYFSKNLVGCNDCFGCVNLRHKSYYIFNEPYSKEEYVKKLEEFNIGSHKNVLAFKEKAQTFWRQFPSKYYHGSHNQDVSGDYIYESKDVYYSYEMIGTENCKYCQNLSTKPSEDCYDYTEWGDKASLVYESLQVGMGINNIKFSDVIYTNSHDVEYSISISDCQNIFGCFGLRHKKYYILNKQYLKDEYEALRVKIIQQMNEMPYIDVKGRVYRYGEFFPFELSPFAYNEAVQEFFPITPEQALEKGYSWRDEDKKSYQPSSYVIPDDIDHVQDDILQAILACEKCQKNYRVIKPELAFYREAQIPVPRLCPDCRHFERIRFRSPMKTLLRNCSNCNKEIQSNITPEISPLIYCQSCYLSEVV